MKKKINQKKVEEAKIAKLSAEIQNMRLFSKPVTRVNITKKKEITQQDIVRQDRNAGKVFKSVPVCGPEKIVIPIQYEDDDLAERERIAQEEKEYKKKCIAPAFNKGPYQYVYSDEDAKHVGRK